METNVRTASGGGVAENKFDPANVSAVVFLAFLSLHTRRDRNFCFDVSAGGPPPLSVSIQLRSNNRPSTSEAFTFS
eukprot:3010438-Amphidinium_carterae.2